MSNLTKHIKEQNYQKLKLLSGKSIGLKGWRMREEKDFLFATESKPDDRGFLIDECIILSKSCVDDKKLYETLTRNDILWILSRQRKLSKGTKIEFQFRCVDEDCPTYQLYDEQLQKETGLKGAGKVPYDAELDLDKDITTRPFNADPITIGKYTFTIKEVSFLDQRALEDLYIKDNDVKLQKFQYHLIKNSVDKIQIEGQEEVFENIDPDELTEIFDDLKPDEYTKLTEETIERKSNFEITKKVQCPECENETDVMYDELFSVMIF